MDYNLHRLNDYQGLLLVIIAMGIWACVKGLDMIHRELECMHEDLEELH